MRATAIYAGLLAGAVVLFLFAPQVDLVTSRWFYVPGHGFVWGEWQPVIYLYQAVPWITWAVLAIAAAGALWLFLSDRPLWRLDRKALVFVVVAIGLGPGLLANTLLKDHAKGARVIAAARTVDKARAACQSPSQAMRGDFLPLACELSEPASIRACIDAVKSGAGPLDAIVCNAGVMAPPTAR